MKTIIALLACLFCGCVRVPKGVTVVSGFDVKRYLGTWYEVARLDHSFERGLQNVSATYSLREDGGIQIENRGFDPARNRWKEAKGRGYLIGEPGVGRLKVSFFGPFYGGYNIIDLDEKGYSLALICGNTRSYLWILSRTPSLPESDLTRLIQKASSLGFDTKALIMVRHDVMADG